MNDDPLAPCAVCRDHLTRLRRLIYTITITTRAPAGVTDLPMRSTRTAYRNASTDYLAHLDRDHGTTPTTGGDAA